MSLFAKNGTYNIAAMASVPAVTGYRHLSAGVVHQPCGDVEAEEEKPTPADAVNLKDAAVGSFWWTRDGKKAEMMGYEETPHTSWPVKFRYKSQFAGYIGFTTTWTGRASSEREKGFPDHDFDILREDLPF